VTTTTAQTLGPCLISPRQLLINLVNDSQ